MTDLSDLNAVGIKNLRRFRIGDWVRVRAVVRSKIDYASGSEWRHKRVLSRRECAFPVMGGQLGVVVGISRVMVGSINHGSGDEPGDFKCAAAPYVWLVRFGMTCRAEKVLDADLTAADLTEYEAGVCSEDGRMLLVEHPVYWSKSDRAAMSEEAKRRPRDERGRFRG